MWNITEPVLIVLVEENPKKAGSAAGERFDFYRPGRFVQGSNHFVQGSKMRR